MLLDEEITMNVIDTTTCSYRTSSTQVSSKTGYLLRQVAVHKHRDYLSFLSIVLLNVLCATRSTQLARCSLPSWALHVQFLRIVLQRELFLQAYGRMYGL